MPATPMDSALYRDLFGDVEVGALFTDSAEVRAMMLAEGALAKAQGQIGMIPETAAEAIHRAALEVQIDPLELTAATGQNGVPVPALVAAFRKAMNAPEHAQYLHWGATSQDIVETGLALRLRQALTILGARLERVVSQLGSLAEAHAGTPMVARTWGQAAVPTSFGAIAANWGAPLLRHLETLPSVQDVAAMTSLSGAAGTLSAMGDKGVDVRTTMSELLSLNDPKNSRHSERDGSIAVANWLSGVANSLGKLGDDVVFHAASGINELAISSAGGSSTMPQKMNPVAPATLVALARVSAALSSAMQGAAIHGQQRDGRAWMTEWLTLPQMVLLCARSLATAEGLCGSLSPNTETMLANLEATNGHVFAEALSFELAKTMGRPEAQAAVKALVTEAMEKDATLADVARRAHPDVNLAKVFSASDQMGVAPDEALSFARAAAQVTKKLN